MSIDSRLDRIEQARKARKRPRDARSEAQLVAARQARWAEYLREKAAYEALSVADKIAHKRQELAEKIAAWEGRDRNAFCVNTDEMHGLRCRHIEIEIMALEGAAADIIETARTQANEDYRYRGRQTADSTILERTRSVLPAQAFVPAPPPTEAAMEAAPVRSPRKSVITIGKDKFEGFRPERDPFIEP
jgi:hypothetical protein